MADTLAVDIKASLQWLFQDTLDLTTVSDASKLEFNLSLADGVGDGQADKLWHALRTVGAGANDDLDLTNLPVSLFGASLALPLARVKALIIINQGTASGANLRVGGAGSGANAWSGPFNGDADALVEVPAGGVLLLVNKNTGWTVTNGSSDILRIHNPTGSAISYQIAIAGGAT